MKCFPEFSESSEEIIKPDKGLWEPPIYSLSVRSTGSLGLDWYLKQGQSQGTKSSNLWDLTPTPGTSVRTELLDNHPGSVGELAGIRKKKNPRLCPLKEEMKHIQKTILLIISFQKTSD